MTMTCQTPEHLIVLLMTVLSFQQFDRAAMPDLKPTGARAMTTLAWHYQVKVEVSAARSLLSIRDTRKLSARSTSSEIHLEERTTMNLKRKGWRLI